jgi:hypothetical protein
MGLSLKLAHLIRVYDEAGNVIETQTGRTGGRR